VTARIEILRASIHGKSGWRQPAGYGHAASITSVAIAAQEIGQVAVSLPFGFLAGDAAGPVAILGFDENANLFVAQDGRWLGRYVPIVFRTYPFKLMALDSGEFALGIDAASGLICNAASGTPFFNNEGNATEQVQAVLRLLMETRRGIETGAAASRRLFELDLLEPWPLKVQRENGETAVEGLFRVNEAKLNSMDDAGFLEARKGGLLALAYAQLLSMGNLGQFSDLARIRASHQKQQEQVKSMFHDTAQDEQLDWDAILKND